MDGKTSRSSGKCTTKKELSMKLFLIPLLLTYIFSGVSTAEDATHEAAISNKKTDSYFENIQTPFLPYLGRAECVANEIQISRTKVIATQAREDGEFKFEERGISYEEASGAVTRILEDVPSAEAVNVLGMLLRYFEENGPQINEGHVPDAVGQPPNPNLAADALKTLIEKPPVPQDRNWQTKGDIEAWQLWHEQIQSGNRTFRFKGDPKDYDLTGPVSKDKLQRVERDRKRDDERTAGQKKSSTPVGAETIAANGGWSYAIAGLVATLALVAAALWYFLRGRRTE
jgi:hypothetical protein